LDARPNIIERSVAEVLHLALATDSNNIHARILAGGEKAGNKRVPMLCVVVS